MSVLFNGKPIVTLYSIVSLISVALNLHIVISCLCDEWSVSLLRILPNGPCIYRSLNYSQRRVIWGHCNVSGHYTKQITLTKIDEHVRASTIVVYCNGKRRPLLFAMMCCSITLRSEYTTRNKRISSDLHFALPEQKFEAISGCFSKVLKHERGTQRTKDMGLSQRKRMRMSFKRVFQSY